MSVKDRQHLAAEGICVLDVTKQESKITTCRYNYVCTFRVAAVPHIQVTEIYTLPQTQDTALLLEAAFR